jgi:hypothetical protein
MFQGLGGKHSMLARHEMRWQPVEALNLHRAFSVPR